VGKLRGIIATPPGLVYTPEFISASEEQALLSYIHSLELEPVVMHDQPSKRRVAHFGLGYSYARRQVTPGPPIPPQLTWLAERAETLAGLEAGRIVEALINHYPVGAPIGWHSDAEAWWAYHWARLA
jgi:alkylated DNA repair dioxygenase AlkB